MNKMLEGFDYLELLGNDILREDIKRETANMESAHLGCFLTNSGATGYGGDMWKPAVQNNTKNPGQDHGCRSPAIPDFNMGSFSLSPIDFEPLPNLFSFGPAYQDFPAYKEKNPHDMADVLLSLKHAVVHPGQVPALSPAANFGLYSSQQTAPGPPQVSPTSVSFSVHPPTQVMSPGCYAPLPQYGHQYADPTPTSTQVGPNPANLFPSMSVNVSMNMTMGMPGGCGVMDQMGSPQQPVGWGAGQAPGGGQHTGAAFPQGPLQMSYAASATPGAHPGYGGGYSFTAEIRPTPCPEPYFDKDYGFKNVAPVAPFKSGKSPANGYGFTAKKRPVRAPGYGFADLNGGALADSGSKVNLCRICGKTYARPSTLKTHMRTHSGEKPYKCATCNKSFSQAANLTAHIRTHSGEKPFRCPICDRRFSQSSSVTTHMRTHSGERPYRCRMCKKAFSDSSTLTKHLRIHSGEKPYQCKLCLLRFSQSGNLNRHMRVHANPI